ncbi:MGMT family protein [Dickeya dianthicola]|uniref:MGMT family protein n=1 Tax=Dickeya dianthicola TaxID=204039 RepID=UPI00136967D7|nr:MGMT family protein [Dickeya dianthicola]MCI4185520.1 MGMT family protein [Dickeya dianthicola]MCI4236231.1 MGMT family protein [Dickeya dianthicola]MCI4253517.1 MGMT family protein [Dickeya dianthicola]MZG20478.1 MGMT family protein [Dickeya dianthicola]MZI89332.1 MGMT family protein [Dickeya dianthicola]
MIIETDNFRQRVIHVIAAIPYGCVVTYGDVARLAGSARAARQVGGILRGLPAGSQLPWYRVINRKGEISLTGPDFQRQKSALQSEGVTLNLEGKIDLDRFRWQYLRDLL